MMVGGYALFATVTTVSASPFIAVPLALAVGAAVGVLVYALLMRPMAGHPVFAAVLVTVSLGILLRVAVVLVYTDQARYPLPAMDLSNPPVRLPGGAAVSALDVVTVASAAALLGGLDRLGGLVAGALIVATVEVLTIRHVNPLLSDVSPFLCLLLMLLVRPWGLWGTREELERV